MSFHLNVKFKLRKESIKSFFFPFYEKSGIRNFSKCHSSEKEDRKFNVTSIRFEKKVNKRINLYDRRITR